MAYVDGGTANTVGTAEGMGGLFNSVKTALLAAGWQILAGSNGTSYRFNAGNPLNPPGPGPTDDPLPDLASWSNASAWARLREPGGPGGREYVFMRATSTTGIIKYSRATGFISQALPANTTLPTTGAGGDGIVWLGSNIGAFDSTTTTAAQAMLIVGSLVGFRYACIASNTPLNGVYGWWWTPYQAGTGTPGSILYTEAVQAGTYPVEDTDPSYRHYGGLATFWANVGNSPPNVPQYWQALGLSGAQYVTQGAFGFPCQINVAGTGFSRGVPSTSIGFGAYYGTTVQTYPILIGSTIAWPKGFSTGVAFMNVNLNNMDTLNLTGAEPRVVIGMNGAVAGWVMPWVPNVVPLY